MDQADTKIVIKKESESCINTVIKEEFMVDGSECTLPDIQMAMMEEALSELDCEQFINKLFIENRMEQKEILKGIKKNMLEESQHTPSGTSTVIKEEFNMDESDTKIVIKKESEPTPSCINTVIKEEFMVDGLECALPDIQMAMMEEALLSEPAGEQFINKVADFKDYRKGQQTEQFHHLG